MKELLRKPKPATELRIDQLRWSCPEDLFDFSCTKEIKTNAGIIGQARAIRAIKTGLEIKHPGYNIFVSGLTGTGRSTTIREILTKLDRRHKSLDDLLYVHQFKNPDLPLLIRLPAGQGKKFRKDMDSLIDAFSRHLPGIFESDAYKQEVEAITEKYHSKERKLFTDFEKRVADAGFAVVKIQMGTFTRPDLMPSIDDKPIPFEELEKSVDEGKYDAALFKEMQAKYLELRKELEKLLTTGRTLERDLQTEIEKTIRRFGLPCVESLINDIRDHYKNETLSQYLNDIRDYTLDEIEIFIKKDDKQNPMSQMMGPSAPVDPFRLFRVNLLVDNSDRKSAPAILETVPNYKNLFGTIEKVVDRSGNWVSDFLNIKAGSILRANGGFLVINLLDAIGEPFVWQTLKRTLKYGQVEIENPESFIFFGQTALKPEAIKIDLKIVLIGDKSHYLMLYNYDEDFKKIFKISADFDDRMDRTDQHIQDYASFIKQLTSQEGIPSFSPSGVAAIIEESVRMADRQTKLSARFSDVADLIRESGYIAGSKSDTIVERIHVHRAVKERIYRRSMIEENIQEYIDDGLIMIDTSGSKIGRINGLAVYDYGEYSFGRPTRITCTISLGRSGIINIEREADLSGNIHDKGIQILSGYLRSRFAQDKPLAFTASICFEQSYGGIDGDSASSTELYLLLSTLAGLPIRQDIAVTGSVNQNGEIQPIGGVNQKIEGFYEVCRNRKMTGKQGVIIPIQNVRDLQLHPEVVEAVQKGRFHVYSVETIDQGLEILTGVKAGVKSNGKWESNTINSRVDQKLHDLAKGIQAFYAAFEEKHDKKAERPKKGPPKPPPPPKQPIRRDEEDKEHWS